MLGYFRRTLERYAPVFPGKSYRMAMKIYEEKIERLENLPMWDVTIVPTFG
jgi:hypothetical protein